MDPNELIKFIVEILVAAGVGFGMFEFLGQRWIENRFARNLEDHKARINSLFSRISKIHEKEFEVLPEAWRLLHDALGRMGALTSPLKTYVDVNSMTSVQLEDFLKTDSLWPYEKEELLLAPDKTDYYRKAMFRHELHAARQAVINFHNYLLYNKIFLETLLFERFKRIDDLLSDAISEQEIGTEAGDLEMVTNYNKTTKKAIEPLISEIAIFVQKRLHYPEA